jgi:hypothetical protein
MGAELVITWCDLPPLATLADPDQAIAALDDDTLGAVHRQWQDIDDDEHDDENGDDWRPATRDRLREALENLLAAGDCTVFDIHGHEVVVGGGTSWGDAPDGYLDVILVATSGIGQLAE